MGVTWQIMPVQYGRDRKPEHAGHDPVRPGGGRDSGQAGNSRSRTESGDAENRLEWPAMPVERLTGKTSSRNQFSSVACGHADHAGLNAPFNMLDSGIGTVACGGALAPVIPLSREQTYQTPDGPSGMELPT